MMGRYRGMSVLGGLLLMVSLVLGPAARGQATGAKPESAKAVLGGSVPGFDVNRYQGANDTWTVTPTDGRPALLPGANGAVVLTHQPIDADAEVDAVLRMVSAAPDYRGASLAFEAGMAPTAGYGSGITFNLAVRAGAPLCDTLDWSISGGTTPHYGSDTWWSLPAARQAWPRDVRRHVEQDMAGQLHLAQRWINIRWVLRQHAMEVYLDGRLLEERSGPAVRTMGPFELRAFQGVELASLKVRPLGPPDPVFEPVHLEGYLNASRFAGQALEADTLPAGKSLTIDGVPFAFPVPDRRGNNHVDLSPSWVLGACMPGYADAAYGDNARWLGALAHEPARIKFSIRNARYTALHLIAASDGAPDTVPIVTAQFYRASAGHPVSFATRVPVFTAHSGARDALPIRLADGRKGNLFLVTIPLEPESLSAFSDMDVVELELTKEVRLYRGSNDPAYYSIHAAGLPSSVQVFAMTLERPKVDFDFEPDRFAHIFTAPEQPAYTLTLRNATDDPIKVHATVDTTSHDGEERTHAHESITVPGHAQRKLHFELVLAKYGYHDVKLTLEDDQGTFTRARSLAYLHQDTRERGDWETGRGVIYGMWDWNGGHITPDGIPRLQVAYDAGIESSMGSFNDLKEPEKEFVLKHQMVTRFLTNEFSPSKEALGGVEWDPSKPEAMAKAVIDAVKKNPSWQATPYNQPSIADFLAEPSLGNHLGIWCMSLPEYYNDPPYQISPDEIASVNKYMSWLLIAGKAVKSQWPNARICWAYGIANFPIAFMRANKEAAALMDGPAIDMAPFEREPELQVGQVTLQNEMWQLRQEWARHNAAKPWPKLITIEGPANGPAIPGSLTQDEVAQNSNRTMLALMAYNVDQFLGWPSLFACAGYWGESHYGGGLCNPLPILSPYVAYPAFATLTRHINRVNYTKYIPTGSLSAYCLQFKHYKTGALVHTMWTLRGTRPVTLEVPPGSHLEVYDSMDNLEPVTMHDAKATFTLTVAPCFIEGLSGDPRITLGEPNHDDAAPARDALKLGNLGDGTWRVTNDRDDYYETAHYEFVRRFPGPMSGHIVDAPHRQGGRALSVHVEPQDKDRLTMPHYAMLVPAAPVPIPGKATHLGLWVHGHSDWGRVVYFVRDANGRQWVSVGTQDDWNNDDTHAWSQFCFDGWRYLDFELPANSAWDGFREAGRVWWGGADVDDDTQVALPLTLERIAIERRDHVVYVTDLLPANPADVELGNLYAEYASPADQSAEAVRVNQVRVRLKGEAGQDNPIARLEHDGVGAATVLQRVEPPEQEYDGRRCLVYFQPVPGAVSYDVWVGRNADGTGAVDLGAGLTAPGALVTGLHANTVQYLFITWTGKDGKVSKPSKPLKVNLKDMFPMK